jgi:hypothetical protein
LKGRLHILLDTLRYLKDVYTRTYLSSLQRHSSSCFHGLQWGWPSYELEQLSSETLSTKVHPVTMNLCLGFVSFRCMEKTPWNQGTSHGCQSLSSWGSHRPQTLDFPISGLPVCL